MLQEIHVQQFSIRHGLTRDLRENATVKDFFNLFIDEAYIDKIMRYTVAYAHLKGDCTFTTWGKISAYLGLNNLSLESVDFLSWQCTGIQTSFLEWKASRKWSQSTASWLWGNIYILPTWLWKTRVCPLITCLEQKFAGAYIPCKNITVDEGLVKFNGQLSFNQYMPMKPKTFGIKKLPSCWCWHILCSTLPSLLGRIGWTMSFFKRKGLGFMLLWLYKSPT